MRVITELERECVYVGFSCRGVPVCVCVCVREREYVGLSNRGAPVCVNVGERVCM